MRIVKQHGQLGTNGMWIYTFWSISQLCFQQSCSSQSNFSKVCLPVSSSFRLYLWNHCQELGVYLIFKCIIKVTCCSFKLYFKYNILNTTIFNIKLTGCLLEPVQVRRDIQSGLTFGCKVQIINKVSRVSRWFPEKNSEWHKLNDSLPYSENMWKGQLLIFIDRLKEKSKMISFRVAFNIFFFTF